MAQPVHFNPKVFLVMLALCAVLAGIAAWLTGLNFWILAATLVAAVLVNGFVASVGDEDEDEDEESS